MKKPNGNIKDPKNNTVDETEDGIGIDVDGDGVIDGYYHHKHNTKKNSNNPTTPITMELKSKEMKQKDTVNVTVEYTIDSEKKIIFGLTTEVKPKETYDDAFKRAYLVCLNAIKEHAS